MTGKVRARQRLQQSPGRYGAIRGKQWPEQAVRRFLLYDVLLHELGHLQIVDATRTSERRKFAMEHCASEFALDWRRRLCKNRYDHADPVQNPPLAAEFGGETSERPAVGR